MHLPTWIPVTRVTILNEKVAANHKYKSWQLNHTKLTEWQQTFTTKFCVQLQVNFLGSRACSEPCAGLKCEESHPEGFYIMEGFIASRKLVPLEFFQRTVQNPTVWNGGLASQQGNKAQVLTRFFFILPVVGKSILNSPMKTFWRVYLQNVFLNFFTTTFFISSAYLGLLHDEGLSTDLEPFLSLAARVQHLPRNFLISSLHRVNGPPLFLYPSLSIKSVTLVVQRLPFRCLLHAPTKPICFS